MTHGAGANKQGRLAVKGRCGMITAKRGCVPYIEAVARVCVRAVIQAGGCADVYVDMDELAQLWSQAGGALAGRSLDLDGGR
jgi:hypothetical protein